MPCMNMHYVRRAVCNGYIMPFIRTRLRVHDRVSLPLSVSAMYTALLQYVGLHYLSPAYTRVQTRMQSFHHP